MARLVAAGPVIFTGAPDGKENRVQATITHARDINVSFAVAMGEIEMLEEHALRRVVVRIHDYGAEVNLVRAIGDVVSRHGGNKQGAS